MIKLKEMVLKSVLWGNYACAVRVHMAGMFSVLRVSFLAPGIATSTCVLENHCLFSRHVCYNWYHICTPFCILVRKILLLLFSHWVVSDSFATPWTVALEAPLFIAFPWQEYWSGLPFFFSTESFQPRDPTWVSLHWRVDSLPLSYQGSPTLHLVPCG